MKKKLNCILLIDDDESTNFLNRILIEKAKCTYNIEVAESGKDALKYLSQACVSGEISNDSICPDLVFIDINMPGMNGWEFLEKYKNAEKNRYNKSIMIMLSTSFDPDDEKRASEMPEVAAFEQKPLTTKKLEYLLQRYFGTEN